MSTINITHEMAAIKEQLTRSAAIRADARQREKEAEEETARSHLRLNNLEIALRNVQRDTERKLKRARSLCERESEPAARKAAEGMARQATHAATQPVGNNGTD
jgi:hypothetical protein